VPGDGAAWIWNTAGEFFPDAILILDRFHVTHTLHRAAQSIFGATSDAAKVRATARCPELDDGKLHTIIRALRPHADSSSRRPNACCTSSAIEFECDIRSFMPKVYASPPAYWRLAAKC
jgi:hypothetical protein